jgi:hypothetical protein
MSCSLTLYQSVFMLYTNFLSCKQKMTILIGARQFRTDRYFNQTTRVTVKGSYRNH